MYDLFYFLKWGEIWNFFAFSQQAVGYAKGSVIPCCTYMYSCLKVTFTSTFILLLVMKTTTFINITCFGSYVQSFLLHISSLELLLLKSTKIVLRIFHTILDLRWWRILNFLLKLLECIWLIGNLYCLMNIYILPKDEYLIMIL